MLREPALLAVLALVSCTRSKGPVGGDEPYIPPDASCSVDDDCGHGEICDKGGECAVGDRDNSSEKATPIGMDDEIAGVIAPEGDIDWYAFESDGPQWIRVQTTTDMNPETGLDTVVRIWKEDGSEWAVMHNFPTGRISTYDTALHAYLPTAGTWYVTVEDVSTWESDDEDTWRGDEDFTYTVQIVPFSVPPSEPDSNLDPFATLDVDVDTSIWYAGVLIDSDGDSDWIRVDTLPEFAGRPLEIWGHASIPGSTANTRVDLKNSAGELVARKDDLGAEDGFLSLFNMADTTYRIQATTSDGKGDADAWYVVYIRTYTNTASHPVLAGPAVYPTEVEPNDSEAGAQLLEPTDLTTSGQPYTGYLVQGELGAFGDSDWYEVEIDPGQMLHVRCFDQPWGSFADLQVQVFFMGSDITPVDQGHDAGELEYYVWDVDTTTGGTAAVRISDESGSFGPGNYYRCRILAADFSFI